MPIDRAIVAANASSFALGNRCGSTRSVSVAMPNGTSGNSSRNRRAALRARW